MYGLIDIFFQQKRILYTINRSTKSIIQSLSSTVSLNLTRSDSKTDNVIKRLYKLFTCSVSLLCAACTSITDRAIVNTDTPLESVNNHLQQTYKLDTDKFIVTGEVTKELAANLNRTYTVIKIEY